MSQIDPENRKDLRRNNIKKKKSLDKRDSGYLDYGDQNKLKKQFKRQKENMFQEELWDEWEDDIS